MLARFPLPGLFRSLHKPVWIRCAASHRIQLFISVPSIVPVYCAAPRPQSADKRPGAPQPGSGQPFRTNPVLTMEYCAHSLGVPLPSLIESRQLSANRLAVHPSMAKLPLVTLYVTERCNSRCVTCDYWRHGRDDMDLAAVTNLLPTLSRLSTQMVLLSGGEPLLNPDWGPIAQTLRSNGLKVWLLTSGLALAKPARPAATLFDAITVSVDGTDAETYPALRGLNAFQEE